MAKRGRPSREPAEGDREKVQQWLEVKTPVRRMAKTLKMSEPTFRKYFSDLLISEKKSPEPPDFPFKIAKVHREDVAFFIGQNMTAEEVARDLGCTVPQLEANFAEEIRVGQARAKAANLRRLREAANDGNVAAMKELQRQIETPVGAQKTSPGYVGKKASANAAAASAAGRGNMFAPPAPPARLATVNGAPVSKGDE